MRTVEASCDSFADIMHYMTVMSRIRNALLNPAWICFLWVGMSIGISIIATPVRFASVSRPLALDIGRHVFAAFNKVELAALVILLIIVRLSGRATRLWSVTALLVLIVIAQVAWLTPELAERTQMIIDGVEPPSSYAHAIYSSLELLKMGVLLYLGFSSLPTSDSK